MKALVTGSTGFIGGQLCRALVAQGYSVRAFHRSNSDLRLLEGLDVEHVLGDLTQPETILPAVQGVDVVFHTAAQLTGDRRQMGRMYTVTVEGTRAVLQAARFAGVQRVVHTSSVAALGVPELPAVPGRKDNQPDRTSAALISENHTWNYRANDWVYGYTKYLAEMEVQRAVAQGLDAVIVNPSVVMGAGDIHRQTNSLVVQVARQHLPVLVEGGINIVHIADVVAGHLAAYERGRCGERYILAGENLTIVELVQRAARVAGVAAPQTVLPAALVRFLVLPMTLAEPFITLPVSAELLRLAGREFYYTIRKAQTELGLPPPHSAEEALKDAYDWFIQVGAIPLT